MALFSVLCFTTTWVPDGPKSRGCWVHSLQRINTCSPLGVGVEWSLIALGRGHTWGLIAFLYSLLANLFFFQPLAFLKYQGLRFLSISRVTDVIARFLVQSLSAGTEVSVFPLLSCYFSVSFLSSKIMLSSLVLVGLCRTYVFCKYSS